VTTAREAMQQALDALDRVMSHGSAVQEAKDILRDRLAQPETVMAEYRFQTYAAYKTDGELKIGVVPEQKPETVIDKSAAIRIATALGWVPPGDTSQDRVYEAAKQRQEPEPTVKWDASAPLVVTPHPAFQAATLRREWVGLTEEEINACDPQEECWNLLEVARAIEAKLRERNNG